ncbi:MAG: sigma-E factor negative regulatory protein [Tepidiphilus sp.]|jgi:sigma-E factor negative regulatory protein RseA|nr:sigma-E factor negative regulatory protein [Tepidiphilus sp.]MDD3432620.1 sigma-E factor negative regulatory protein [Tepidiphilus sp.]
MMMRDTKTTPEALSALVDGELDGADTASWVQRLTNDPAMAQRWLAYHLIGEALRGELPGPRHRDLRSVILRRIALEPSPVTRIGPERDLRAVANEPKIHWFATAAAAALVLAVGWGLWQTPREDEGGANAVRLAEAEVAAPSKPGSPSQTPDEQIYWIAYGNAHGPAGVGGLRYARVMAQQQGGR